MFPDTCSNGPNEGRVLRGGGFVKDISLFVSYVLGFGTNDRIGLWYGGVDNQD